jgi:pimeloyl-ACP methyl ester carboxylesterase
MGFIADRPEENTFSTCGLVPNELSHTLARRAHEQPSRSCSGDGMHLVGHSYGGVISLLAAAHSPEAVRSLTVIEPPAFGLVENDPEHAPFVAKLRRFFADPSPDPETFLKGFIEVSGSMVQLPSPLPPPLEQNARVLMGERFPGDAVIPLEGLRSAAFPKLVVSGAHNRAFTAVCDVLTRSIGGACDHPGQGTQRAENRRALQRDGSTSSCAVRTQVVGRGSAAPRRQRAKH